MRPARTPRVESRLTAENPLCHPTGQMQDFMGRNLVYLDMPTAGVAVQSTSVFTEKSGVEDIVYVD
jgi:hypothetical protein